MPATEKANQFTVLVAEKTTHAGGNLQRGRFSSPATTPARASGVSTQRPLRLSVRACVGQKLHARYAVATPELRVQANHTSNTPQYKIQARRRKHMAVAAHVSPIALSTTDPRPPPQQPRERHERQQRRRQHAPRTPRHAPPRFKFRDGLVQLQCLCKRRSARVPHLVPYCRAPEPAATACASQTPAAPPLPAVRPAPVRHAPPRYTVVMVLFNFSASTSAAAPAAPISLSAAVRPPPPPRERHECHPPRRSRPCAPHRAPRTAQGQCCDGLVQHQRLRQRRSATSSMSLSATATA